MKEAKNLRIEIIAVGSELLSPHFQDTNSLFITERLNDLGLCVHFKSIVGDEWDDLCSTIEKALARADLIFSIGGLGPTQDDRTREAFASVLGRKLIFEPDILQSIEARFSLRGLSMPEVSKKQAYLIEGCEVIKNHNGTAPGLWLETDTNMIGLLPGPPHELKPMFDSSFWPRLKRFQRIQSARKILKIAGLTESKVQSLTTDVFALHPEIQMIFLAYPGQIEIHLLSQSPHSTEHAEKKIEALTQILRERLGSNIFSEEGQSLESVIGRLLQQRNETLAVAESCTGGFLGHRITNIPGSSNHFLLGVVAYSNAQKERMLGISPDLIDQHGAVSAEVAREMAIGVKHRAGAHYGLGITGIAGPGGGTEETPVGLVYTSLASEEEIQVEKNIFLGDREHIKFQSTQKALDLLRRYLLQSH
jgi:nicotinamide-nucleotide amidase